MHLAMSVKGATGWIDYGLAIHATAKQLIVITDVQLFNVLRLDALERLAYIWDAIYIPIGAKGPREIIVTATDAREFDGVTCSV